METSFPDGVGERHRIQRRYHGRGPSPLPLGIFVVFAALGLTGMLGGGQPTTLHAENEGVRLTAKFPPTVRTGEYFEGEIEITTDRPISDLTIGASRSLLDGFTLNSMFPEPESEAFEGGVFRFSFGRIETGASFLVQSDFQTNPSTTSARSGVLSIHDGDTELVRLPLHLKVLP